MPRPIRAAISSGAIAHNLSVARRHAGSAKVWAVIKANAYGHGLERAARAAVSADGLAVLDFDEAARLRLTPVIHRREQIEMLAAASAPLDVYLKVNSGMNRLGFAGVEVAAAYQSLADHPRVNSLTLMTHFADADGATGIAAQLERFASLTKSFRGVRSLANSAALIRFPEARGDWVRPGIMLYGCSPFADRSAEALGLRPAMTLTTEIIATQEPRAGDGVGYGLGFKAERPMRIGVIALAESFARSLPSIIIDPDVGS